MPFKITISKLTCNETEDNTGEDECELRIWADEKYQSHRKKMNNGDVWDVNVPLVFNRRVKIQLWDLDQPSFFDGHDHLGTITVRPDQSEGAGQFTQDGADYDLDWIQTD